MNPEKRISEWQIIRTAFLFMCLIGIIYVGIKFLLLPLINIALIPVILSLFVCVILEPFVVKMESKGLNRRTAVNISFTIFYLLLILFLFFTATEFSINKISDAPSFILELFKTLDAGLKKMVAPLEKSFPDANIYGRISTWVNTIAEWLVGKISSFFSTLFYAVFLTPFITYFLLRDRRNILKKIMDVVPNRYFEMSVYLIRRIVDQLESYLRGKLVESLVIAIVIIAFLFPLHPPYLVTQAVFAGIMNIIPYIGPVIGSIPGILIAIYSFSPNEVFYVLFVYFIIAQLIVDNMILIPFFLSHVSNLHPLTVIFAIAVGGEVGGIIGMIVSIPVFMALKIVLMETYYYFKFKGKLPA